MNLYQLWCLKKAKIKFDRIIKCFDTNEKVLDIGSGNAALMYLFQQEGINIQGLDVQNKSAFESIQPMIYDGSKLPYEDDSFDTVQLITVLHHVKDPENLLMEALRVASRVIIMEDIYENSFQKYMTFFADSLNNMEFFGHPHTNKTDREWKQLFREKGIDLLNAEYYQFMYLFRQVSYILQ